MYGGALSREIDSFATKIINGKQRKKKNSIIYGLANYSGH